MAAVGAAAPLPGSTVSLAMVQPAAAEAAAGIMGVVEGRLVLTPRPHPAVQPGDVAATEAFELHRADGPAQAGDYVALTVLGVAQVKVDTHAGAIQPGQRLTVAGAGRARALQTRTVDGMVVAEGLPGLGIALAAPQEGQQTIPVFVTLR